MRWTDSKRAHLSAPLERVLAGTNLSFDVLAGPRKVGGSKHTGAALRC